MKEAGQAGKNKIIRVSLFALVAAATVFLFFKLFSIILPFFLALLLAYLLRPLLNRMLKLGIYPASAILVLYCYLFIAIALTLMFMVPIIVEQGQNLLLYLPDLVTDIKKKAADLSGSLQRISLPQGILDAFNAAEEGLHERMASLVEAAAFSVTRLFKVVLYLALTPILAYYVLRDKNGLSKKIIAIFPTQERAELARIGRDIDHLLQQYVVGYLLISVIVALMSAGFFYAIGMDYALALGLIMGIADLIPYFGPLLGAIPAVIVAMGESESLALITAIGLVVLQQVEGVIITPKIMGDKIGLHPLTTIFVVLAGGYLFGLLGTLLAVPAAAALLLCGRYIYARCVGADVSCLNTSSGSKQ